MMTTNAMTPEIASRLDAIFEPWNRNDQPGLAVGIARDGALLYRRGFGMASLESAAAIGPATRMRIGSTSKHFTCLLVLLLSEEKLIDLDASVGTYLPELEGEAGVPTIRQLMYHRGGGRDYVDLGFLAHGWNDSPAGTALRMQARQSDRNFAPGTAMLYNNGGYHLLSVAAERVGGASFEELLSARLFQPLAMYDTVSAPSDHIILPGMATLHVPLLNGQWRRGLFPSEEVKGEGAIVSTIDDMLRWIGHLRTRDRFGTAESWDALLTPMEGVDPRLGAYTMGLQLADYRGVRTISHSGGVIGGSCEMMILPDYGLDIVIITNGAPGADPTALSLAVADALLETELGAHPVMPRAADHTSMLGQWWSPETGMVYGLTDVEGALRVEVCSQPFGLELRLSEDGRIVLPESSTSEVEFRAVPGQADALDIAFGGATHRYRRLDASAIDPVIFARQVEGRYYSHDADATATFTLSGGELSVTIEDCYGSISGPVTPLDADVGGLGPLAMIYWCVISLDRDKGDVVGFRLDAMRTRHLTFRKV